MSLKNEKELIKEFKKDDKSLIDQIYYAYHKRIFAFALSYLKVEEDALDVVHEVFLKLWKNRHKLNNDGKIEPFIFTLTRNTVLSIFRKRASEQKYINHLAKFTIQSDISTEKMVNYDLLNEKMEELLDQLPPRCKETFVLSRQKGLSNKEIGSKMHISEKTVEDHITKALTFMKRGLLKSGIAGLIFFYLFL